MIKKSKLKCVKKGSVYCTTGEDISNVRMEANMHILVLKATIIYKSIDIVSSEVYRY